MINMNKLCNSETQRFSTRDPHLENNCNRSL